MNPINYITAEEAVQCIQSNQRVYLHGSAATPVCLINALIKQKERLKQVELVSISLKEVDLNDPALEGHFYINSLFVSESNRIAVNSNRGDYIPVFLSEISQLFTRNILPLDVAIVHVSPPDKHGYCSLGPSVDIARSAVQNAKKVIAQVNPNIPRVHGDAFVDIRRFDALVWVEDALPEVRYDLTASETDQKIGKLVADMIEDGATLQLGIGNIPNAVLNNLANHKDLGLHTEMFSDGVIPLIQNGIINNSKKKIIHGYNVTSFIMGSRKLYDFVDDNPIVKALDINYVNDPYILSQNPKVTAINSAIEIDITGQVCSDSIGTLQYSGIGGQMDFIRGAALSEGGKPIIALPSVTSKGLSRIVPVLKEGAGVVTTRGHIHWVVTENGLVNLFGMNMEQRAKALIKIAHPDHQEQLNRYAFQRFGKN
ncbi:MAG: acetyl-CoA hydrolase/transferase family protein [Saprospiraceae bacterium]|nr:acetyl-CoA hydrolase/transferase family protein [Saprospiraceae bacterium]MBK7738549.1 acetyl-CoA hydrolase/transferase family protein [Saprospiraceae bacterium]MBK7912879.1 acetyl-CoA hydrolase/transferase family protein [Saprospiraceae bacterium]